MAESNLMQALRDIAVERGIDEVELLTRLEEHLAPVYERVLRLAYDARVMIDRETGAIYVFELVPTNEDTAETDEELEFEERDVTPAEVSRIAAHQAKSIINSMVREARREKVYHDYKGRVGELITGLVQQTNRKFTIMKLDNEVEAELPRREQPDNERYHFNERIKCVILAVNDPELARESGVILSRKDPQLIKRLFEIEVPEVYDGIVEFRSIAREAGVRSKVAVSSREPGLDPVGACVGPGGSRVRNVVTDLRGERIDIIPYSDDPATFVASALSPAKVERVIIDKNTHTANVIVSDNQLSLAIGKEGQNARLAAQLTGWRIDVKNLAMATDQGLVSSLPTIEEDRTEEGERICAAVTADGAHCRNHARPGSLYCGVHEKTATKAAQG
ncbi:MAG: transcription termination factor NusA [Actinomycetia bacterium]|nr:transcription termination factor NusA [Actinomycetes bacterium]